jgi:mRNA interferase YafQ
VSYTLLRSTAFVRDAKRLLQRNPEAGEGMLAALDLLQADPFAASLKTHKLKGKLKTSWGCSGGYDLRIVFSFTKFKGKPAILLETVGTHDDVY